MRPDPKSMAFPAIDGLQQCGSGICGVTDKQTGLTKREYFAGVALGGLLTQQVTVGDLKKLGMNADQHAELLAFSAKRIADALLAELGKAEVPHA